MKSGQKDFREICLDKCSRLMDKYSPEEILGILNNWEDVVSELKHKKDRDQFFIAHNSWIDGG